MFTDIVGSTMLRDSLIAKHGEGEGNQLYRERFLDPHNTRIRESLAKHDGFEVKTNGDSFMVAFEKPRGCGASAAAIQRRLRGGSDRHGHDTARGSHRDAHGPGCVRRA
jgi:class 3 adenylate cyclase